MTPSLRRTNDNAVVDQQHEVTSYQILRKTITLYSY